MSSWDLSFRRWILMATMFLRELSLSVVLSRAGTEMLTFRILRYAENGLWGKLSALGILMILVSTTLAVLASFVGARLTKLEKGGQKARDLSGG